MGVVRRLWVVERLLVVYFHGCYLLKEHCVLSQSFGSVSSLERRFLKLGALARHTWRRFCDRSWRRTPRHGRWCTAAGRRPGRGRECWLRGSAGERSASGAFAQLCPHQTVGLDHPPAQWVMPRNRGSAPPHMPGCSRAGHPGCGSAPVGDTVLRQTC